jgi:hypothetical protein
VPISAAPPKPKSPPRSAPRAKAGPPPSMNEARKNGLAGYVQIGQLFCGIRGQHADAETLRMYGPDFCTAVADVADQDENLARGVDYLCAGGPYTALFAALVPMAFQIAANHNRISPDAMPGLEDPALLSARYKDRLRRVREAAEEEARAYEADAMAVRLEEERATVQGTVVPVG